MARAVNQAVVAEVASLSPDLGNGNYNYNEAYSGGRGISGGGHCTYNSFSDEKDCLGKIEQISS